MDLNAYQADLRTKSAVERQLQVITEAAAVRLGDEAEVIAPGPDWRGTGNILRHASHRIDDELIWNTAMDKLPPMKEAIFKALTRDVGPAIPRCCSLLIASC